MDGAVANRLWLVNAVAGRSGKLITPVTFKALAHPIQLGSVSKDGSDSADIFESRQASSSSGGSDRPLQLTNDAWHALKPLPNDHFFRPCSAHQTCEPVTHFGHRICMRRTKR
jgi:hypothetical protein